MQAVHVRQLRKTFRIQKNREGLGGAIRDLWKRDFQEVVAVKDLDLDIPQGEICGYIGENGAGKSTTIKMLTGILVPTSGEISVLGYVPHKEREAYVRNIGVVFGQRSQLWWDIGVIESFRLLRKVYRVPPHDFERRMAELVERLQIGDILNRPVRKLSLGQRMRCELAAALLHNPQMVFLDEPTIGLDIVVKSELREFLLQMNRDFGTTIMLTTHDLQDIEALCSRVVILDDGQMIYDGSLDELRRKWGQGKLISLQFASAQTLPALQALTSDLPLQWAETDEFHFTVLIPAEHEATIGVSEVLRRIVMAGELKDMQITDSNTDEIVRELYKSGPTMVRG